MLVVGVVLAMLSLPARGAPPEAATQVIVLGVDHAAQLAAREDRPAVLAAFLDRAAPDAICIERSPEAFARNDFYEFTYEVQDVVVPFARERNIDVCPFDWHPSTEDAQLGFGMDLEAIPEIRPIRGFQQFLTFPEPAQLHRTLFHADDPQNVARAHPGGIVVAQPSSLGALSDADIQRQELPAYRFAVAAGRPAEADRLRTALGRELTARQRRQLDDYWPLLAK